MKLNYIHFLTSFVMMLNLISAASFLYSQEKNYISKDSARSFKFTRIYSDSSGNSHFSSDEMTFRSIEFSPQLPRVLVTKPNITSNMVIVTAPAGGKADWHCVPNRQFNIILSGEVEIEVSDGEVKRFGPGSLILGEDTKGKGHITRALSNFDAYFVIVALPVR